jgi:hypothetical protein
MAEELQEILVASIDDLDRIEGSAARSRAIVSFEGRLDARGVDSHLLLRLNRSSTGYQSFVIADGHHHAGEWDGRGIYVGRNGWHLDCDISFRFVIAVATGRKRTAFGMSTFAHADDRIIGYTANGFWNNSHAQITSIGLWAVGGGQPVGNLSVAWE